MKICIPYEKPGKNPQGKRFPKIVHVACNCETYQFLSELAEKQRVSIGAVIRFAAETLREKIAA